jgi:hypothetical protein
MKFIAKLTAILAIWLVGADCSFAQTLALASGQAAPGSAVALNLSFSSGSPGAAALQWKFSYPAAAITGITAVGGPALTAAGKTLSCFASSTGYTCVASGMNSTAIPSGVLATFTVTTSASFTGASLALTSAFGSTALGDSVSITGTGGTISPVVVAAPALSSFTCNNLSFSGASSTTCTVALTKAALAGGTLVSLASSSQYVTVPTSVSVPQGNTGASFTATIKAFTTSQTAAVTAAAGGVNKSVSLSLNVTSNPSVSSLSCAPDSVGSNQLTQCTVGLSATAPQLGFVVSLTSSSNLLAVPSTVKVLAGQSSAAFGATAGTITTAGSATITALGGGPVGGLGVKATITLKASSGTKPTITFSASPASITAGSPATLSWSVSGGATSISIDQGIGSVAATGTRSVTPAVTTTYTITAANASGSSTSATTVSVNAVTQTYSVSFATYLGGSKWEQVRDIVTDSAGNIIVVGGTDSSNFKRTVGQAYAGSVDAFVTKLDPNGKLIWSTLLGGPNYDRAYAVKVDMSGNIYLAGRAGPQFPVKNGFQPTFKGYNTGSAYGQQNAFVAKLNSSGNVLWASYCGTGEMIRDLDIDPSGSIYVVSGYAPQYGQALQPSAWFSTAFQKTPPGNTDLVIAKVATDGSAVRWATYLGGSSWENTKSSIRVDPSGNLVILCDTESSNMPVPNGYQRTNRGVGDAYLAKMKSDGTGLIWATYFGGSNRELNETHHLAVDRSGNVYIGLTTSSTDAPTTAGAYRRTYSGSGMSSNHAVGDAIIAKFSPVGQLLASTYVGGSDGDGPQGLAVDAGGNVYFSGGTVSADFPDTPNAAQASKKAGEDAFAVRLRADFSALDYSTFLGSSGDDEGRVIWADQAGNMYVGIEMRGSDFPLIKNALQASYGGGTADVVLAKLSPATQTNGDTTSPSTEPNGGTTKPPPVSLVNGSFESGGQGWQKTTNGGRSVVTAQAHTGTRSVQMTASKLYPREVFQDAAVSAGTAYEAQGWMMTTGIGSGARISLVWLNTSGSTLRTDLVGIVTGTQSWALVSGKFTAPVGATAARFELSLPEEPDNAGTAWFDDLSLK